MSNSSNREEQSNPTANKLPKTEDVKRTVMIPIDGSEHSLRAFDWYAVNAHQEGDLVVFINVVEPVVTASGLGPLDAPPLFSTAEAQENLNGKINEAKALSKDYMQKAKKKNFKCHAFLHIDNKPGRALVESCKDHDIDLVVIGSRGLGTIRRTFMGSVSDFVLHHCRKPVIVIPPTEKL